MPQTLQVQRLLHFRSVSFSFPLYRDLVTSSANGERITDATENLGKSLRDHEVRLEKLVEQVAHNVLETGSGPNFQL